MDSAWKVPARFCRPQWRRQSQRDAADSASYTSGQAGMGAKLVTTVTSMAMPTAVTPSRSALSTRWAASRPTEDCAALLVCAPSSGLSTNPYKIVTTDLLGRAGVSAGDCSITFGGTSAAAPVVAGAVALVLSANPALGWRDVQGILAASTDAIDDADPGWQLNGGGLRFNHKYGFGRVNASRAVTLAREWLIYGDEFTLTPGLTAFAPGAFESKARLSTNLRVEGVEVVFTARVARRGRLAVNLLSPFGTLDLAPFHPDAAADYPGWRFGSVAHWGEASAGDWTLRLEADGGIPFSNASWTLLVYGRADPTLSAPGERL